MALSNSQYEEIMRTYESRRYENEKALSGRFTEIYEKIPRIKVIDDEVSTCSIRAAKSMLYGDRDAKGQWQKQLSFLLSEKKRLLQENGYPEDYLQVHYTCPDCQDTGYIGTEKCHCLKERIVRLLYEQSNIQDILERENFSTFSMRYYSANHMDPCTGRSALEAMRTALEYCHRFVDQFETEHQNILLYGDTGVGKSFLSHCIAKEIIDKGHFVLYFSAVQLFELLARSVFHRDDDRNDDFIRHLYECDLLIIDDLGTELVNSFTSSQLFSCLNERILARKATIISTNLSLDDVQSMYSERIFSRITSSYLMLRVTGDDIRIQKKLSAMEGAHHAAP